MSFLMASRRAARTPRSAANSPRAQGHRNEIVHVRHHELARIGARLRGFLESAHIARQETQGEVGADRPQQAGIEIGRQRAEFTASQPEAQEMGGPHRRDGGIEGRQDRLAGCERQLASTLGDMPAAAQRQVEQNVLFAAGLSRMPCPARRDVHRADAKSRQAVEPGREAERLVAHRLQLVLEDGPHIHVVRHLQPMGLRQVRSRQPSDSHWGVVRVQDASPEHIAGSTSYFRRRPKGLQPGTASSSAWA